MPVPLSPSMFTSPPPHSALAALQAANVNLHLLSEKMATYLMKGVQQNDRTDVSFSSEQLSVLQSATWGALIKAASDCMASAPPSPASSMRKDGYASHNISFTHREEMEFATPLRHALLSSNTTSPITSQGRASKRSNTPSRWVASIPPAGPITTSLSTEPTADVENHSSTDTSMVSAESSTSQLNTPQPNPSLKFRPTPSDSSKKLIPHHQSLALRSPSTSALPVASVGAASTLLSSSFSPAAPSSNSAVASPAASIMRAPIAADLLATPVQLHSTLSSLKGTPVSLSKMRAELASVSLGTGATPMRSANPSQRLHMKEHAIRSLQHTPSSMTVVEHPQQQQHHHEEFVEEAKRPILASEPLAPSQFGIYSGSSARASTAAAARRSVTPSRAAIVPPSDSESDAEEMEQLIAFKMRVDPSPMSASMRITPSSSAATAASNAASKYYQTKPLSASSPYAVRHHTNGATVTPSTGVSKAAAVVDSVLSTDEAASVQMPSHSSLVSSSATPLSSPDSTPLHTRTKSHLQRSKAYSSDEDEEEDCELAAKAQHLFNQHRQHTYSLMNGEQQKLTPAGTFSPSQSFSAASNSMLSRSIPTTPMQDLQAQQERAYDRHKYSDVKKDKPSPSSDSEDSD